MPDNETDPNTQCQLEVPTIKAAQDLYLLNGEGSIHKGFRDVIKSLVKSGYQKSIPNDSYADALFLTDIMLEHTEKSFRMLSGRSGDGFIGTLASNFEKMLKRLSEVGGKAKVILIRRSDQGKAECTKLMNFKAQFPDALDIATGVSDADQRHYIVSDSQMFRIEEVHPPLTPETPANAVKAQVYVDSPLRAKMQEESFDLIWNILRPKK